ncbi:pyridoxine/pyridoxamine 5'-phosphate oxidase isoform X2 [Megachile rotundata]|uniref:pyridoxine/pyridoxamine 5'-phosphate oxidase isoform X2 n=1 Tax=Megachile rotundata TaxID=143995 RepID=UPI000614DAC9|nr:PREDICTED: pyridoxine-5'-phosphate oxidase isoform X2 [Megachile rotundata]
MIGLVHCCRRVVKSILLRESWFVKGSKQGVDLSDLAKIEEETDNPIELFRIWRDEARKYNPRAPDACCLATVSKNCEVSARNVILREFDNDGFVIVTDSRSKKVHNIESVPQVAMCYMWFYVNEQEQEITRQVRVEGTMIRLKKEEFQHLYEREPLYCKVRAHLCHQGREVYWEELKQRHDEILDSVRRNDNDLRMPDHFVGYKLLPTMMEFYFARDHLIGDRLLYRKDTPSGSWQHHRIAA